MVDLVVEKLSRLPVETQNALHQLACLGNNAEFALLTMVYQETQEEMHHNLWEAVRAGLIFRSEVSYKFLHDRVREAAYSLISERSRADAQGFFDEARDAGDDEAERRDPRRYSPRARANSSSTIAQLITLDQALT